jgi:hypothetical protein
VGQIDSTFSGLGFGSTNTGPGVAADTGVSIPLNMSGIWVEHEPVKHQAHQAAVAAIGFERVLDVLLDAHIGFAQLRIERDLADALLIGRKIIGDVFERDEDI